MSDSVLPQTEGVPGERVYTPPYPAMSSGHLEKRLLHKVLVAVNAPTDWPGWLIGSVALVPIAGVAGLWWLLIGDRGALFLAVVLAAFILTDALMLVGLRRWRFSFGPVGPQLFTLEFPRLLTAVLAIPVAVWFGPAPAVIGVVLVNLGASLALVWGTFLEPQRLSLSHLTLKDDLWRQGAPPLRLLHITDLHVERFSRREAQLVQMVREIAPDVILLTGDYLNLSYVDDPIAHAHARRVLTALSSGKENLVYAVLGSPPVDRSSASLFDGLPIRLLRDEVVTIDLPTPSGSPPTQVTRSQGRVVESGQIWRRAQRNQESETRRLALLGLDCSHSPVRDAARLAAVVAQAPSDAFRVLLYHSPELMPVAPNFDVNLYLCGHTHGGQVRLPFYGALLTSSEQGKRFEMGHYRSQDTHLYVSRGVGLEGLGAPRVRFLCPPEITLVSIQGPEDRQEENQ